MSRTVSVITVRMSPEQHEELKREAHRAYVSLNAMCLMKIVEPLPGLPDDDELVDWQFASQWGERMGMRTRVIERQGGDEIILDCESYEVAGVVKHDTCDILVSQGDKGAVVIADATRGQLRAFMKLVGVQPRSAVGKDGAA